MIDLDLIMLVFDEKTVSNDALDGPEVDTDENSSNADISGQLNALFGMYCKTTTNGSKKRPQ